MDKKNSQNSCKEQAMRLGFLDLLDEKSLSMMRKFGHIYSNPYSGKTQMRVYKPRAVGQSNLRSICQSQ